eukprot:4295560-Alexandrium_andersonii.AAC.1
MCIRDRLRAQPAAQLARGFALALLGRWPLRYARWARLALGRSGLLGRSRAPGGSQWPRPSRGILKRAQGPAAASGTP